MPNQKRNQNAWKKGRQVFESIGRILHQRSGDEEQMRKE